MGREKGVRWDKGREGIRLWTENALVLSAETLFYVCDVSRFFCTCVCCLFAFVYVWPHLSIGMN